MAITPTFELINKLYEDMNTYLVKYPQILADTQLIRDAILEVEIKLSNQDSVNDVLDEIEFYNGINYDETKGY